MDNSRTVYENGNARFEVHDTNGELSYWIQVGVAGLAVFPDELADLYEMIDAYIKDFDDE